MKDLDALKEAIRASVTLSELMQSRGLIRGTAEEEQFRCPFHGADNKPSARYYSRTDSAYCWVCKQSWDVIRFVQKIEEMSFSQAINHLVKIGKVDLSKIPDTLERKAKKIEIDKGLKASSRKVTTEKLKRAIMTLRGHVPEDRYARTVYAYMMVKYTVEDKEFPELAEKLKTSIIRLVSEAGHG